MHFIATCRLGVLEAGVVQFISKPDTQVIVLVASEFHSNHTLTSMKVVEEKCVSNTNGLTFLLTSCICCSHLFLLHPHTH